MRSKGDARPQHAASEPGPPDLGASGNQKTAVGKRHMTVMSPTERQLMRYIIDERDERIKAVNDLKVQWEEVQGRVTAQLALPPPVTSANWDKVPLENSFASSLDVETLRTELRSELRSRLRSELRSELCSELRVELRNEMQAAELRGGTAVELDSELANQQLVALQERVREAEADLRRELEQARADIVSLGNFVNKEFDNFCGSANRTSTGSHPVVVAPRADERARRGSGGGLSEADGVAAGAQGTLCAQVKAIEDKLAEVFLTMPLLAIRSSRIALHSHDLAREERRMSLKSLETTERQVKEEVERFRQRMGHTGPMLGEVSNPLLQTEVSNPLLQTVDKA